jgi:bifunctional non-homologous end joining protein LigD
MSLTQYRRKRHFQQTPEPEGAVQPGTGALRFVVQKHHASRLHYDFRLELDGVLKSWAVPKGPSLDPRDKRLAMMVEDHPLEYRTFEGIIPKGNYGAGTVMVWDEGTYHAAESTDPGEAEVFLRKGLEKGHLRLVLQGKKLRGEFALVKLRKGEANAWLLFKKNDQYAETTDVRTRDRSAVSGRTLEEIAAQAPGSGEVWASNRTAVLEEMQDAPKGKPPRKVKPMLATLVDKPFDRAGWLFEIKWDGYRAIAEVSQGGIRLYSRKQLSFNERYQPVVTALGQLGHEAVLDGEIVVLDGEGKPRFQLLQNYEKTREGQLVYYVFDLLYLDGRDLRSLPLSRRKKILQAILGKSLHVRLSYHVEQKGKLFLQAAKKQGLEGIMAKDGASPYREGKRTHEWLKIKLPEGRLSRPRRTR